MCKKNKNNEIILGQGQMLKLMPVTAMVFL